MNDVAGTRRQEGSRRLTRARSCSSSPLMLKDRMNGDETLEAIERERGLSEF